MLRERVAHLGGGAEAPFGFVLDRPHQNPLHLVRDGRVYLPRRRVLREVEDEQRVVLRVCAREEVEHGRAEAVDVRARLGLAAEQLRRRVAHRADRGHALLCGPNDSSYPEIDKHHTSGLVIDHQIRRFQVAVDDWRLL